MSSPRTFTTTTTISGIASAMSVVGVSLLDTSTAANQVSIYDGTDATGKLIASVDLVASKAADLQFAHPRTVTSGSIYIACTGTVKGTVHLA